ncbi:MAG: glycerate-2-kinase family protein, partial [Desulfobacterales bacterium]
MNDGTDPIDRMRTDATAIFMAGVEAVAPGAGVKRYCRYEDNRLWVADNAYLLSRYDHLYVVGAGKGCAPMAAAIEDILGPKITGGIINVKYGHATALDHISLVEAGHPLPDEKGENGSGAIRDLLETAGKDDLVICLLSGGGSALLPLPVENLTLKDKQDTTDVLLSCGARI